MYTKEEIRVILFLVIDGVDISFTIETSQVYLYSVQQLHC